VLWANLLTHTEGAKRDYMRDSFFRTLILSLFLKTHVVEDDDDDDERDDDDEEGKEVKEEDFFVFSLFSKLL
tara:strand:- start:175 stop:390 length:216 start_codon:yes stop_codon:yes gene_type:complete